MPAMRIHVVIVSARRWPGLARRPRRRCGGSSAPPEGIAIVGMTGRFPGADSIDELWANLLAGREGITRFAPDQLSPLVPPELARHPRYVAARGVMADADRFDAAFFGIPPREALLMDPQQRVFLEAVLECAGARRRRSQERFPGSIGVYAGTSNNNYRKLVESRADLVQAAGDFQPTMLLPTRKTPMCATRVAHRLNLTGPALSIHTACSTSLVAIAQAWLRADERGGAISRLPAVSNIAVPQESGLPARRRRHGIGRRPLPALRCCGQWHSVLIRWRGGGAGSGWPRRLRDGDTIYAVIRRCRREQRWQRQGQLQRTQRARSRPP